MAAYIDIYALIGLFLMLFPFVAWYFVAAAQHKTLKNGVYRVQVLSTRCALMLPSYAVLIFIAVCKPKIIEIMEVPIAIAEGFSFYTFFDMLITNLGGSESTIREMIAYGKDPCCCCPSSPIKFFKRVKWALFQFLFVRPIVVLLAAIFNYADVKALFLVFTFIAVFQFLFGFGSLALFYENVYTQSGNINATLKIILLKVSVGVYVIQGIIEEMLVATDTLDIKDTDRYTAEERAGRALGIVVLAEYAIMSLILYISFSTEIHASTYGKHAGVTDLTANSRKEVGWGAFLCEVFTFWDIFSEVFEKVDESHLTQNLLTKA